MHHFASILASGLPELLLADGRATDKLNAAPPFLEVALTLAAAVLLLWRPRFLEGPLRRAWRGLARLRGRRAILASGLGALLASAITMVWLGLPVPNVPDELGYLLIGDTLAHGRLANPTPRVPEAFESTQLLVRPSYASKYPPAQGGLLAIGQLLGHPGFGVCLSVGLFAAAVCWFLQGWLPAPWPLVGTALLALRVGLGSYWGQSYWGGVTTAVGALLLYGALPRLYRRPPRLLWLPLAGGLFLLANSRPFEGAVASLPAAILTATCLAQRWRTWWRPALALAVALGVAAAVTAAYNRAVTGDPLLHPYRLHMATYGVDAMSPYLAPPPPVRHYSSPVLADYFGQPSWRPDSWREALLRAGGHFARMAYFVCGLPLLVFLLLGLRRLPARRARSRWKLVALLCCVLPAALHSVTSWWFPHYSATATGPLLLLGLLGMREAAAGRCGARRLGPWTAAAALLVQAALTPAQLRGHRPGPDHPSSFRQCLERRFAARDMPGLVVVADRLRHDREWVFNRADLDSAPLLWIQDLGPEVTRQVAAAYAPRQIFRLVPDEDEDLPQLLSVPGGAELSDRGRCRPRDASPPGANIPRP